MALETFPSHWIRERTSKNVLVILETFLCFLVALPSFLKRFSDFKRTSVFPGYVSTFLEKFLTILGVIVSGTQRYASKQVVAILKTLLSFMDTLSHY